MTHVIDKTEWAKLLDELHAMRGTPATLEVRDRVSRDLLVQAAGAVGTLEERRDNVRGNKHTEHVVALEVGATGVLLHQCRISRWRWEDTAETLLTIAAGAVELKLRCPAVPV